MIYGDARSSWTAATSNVSVRPARVNVVGAWQAIAYLALTRKAIPLVDYCTGFLFWLSIHLLLLLLLFVFFLLLVLSHSTFFEMLTISDGKPSCLLVVGLICLSFRLFGHLWHKIVTAPI